MPLKCKHQGPEKIIAHRDRRGKKPKLLHNFPYQNWFGKELCFYKPTKNNNDKMKLLYIKCKMYVFNRRK